MKDETQSMVVYHWEELDKIIGVYSFSSYGAEEILHALGSRIPKTREEYKTMNMYVSMILSKARSEILTSYYKGNPEVAAELLDKVDYFAARYSFDIPEGVSRLRNDIYRMARAHYLVEFNPNSFNYLPEIKIRDLSHYLGDFSVARSLPLDSYETMLASIDEKDALDHFVERMKLEKTVKAVKGDDKALSEYMKTLYERGEHLIYTGSFSRNGNATIV